MKIKTTWQSTSTAENTKSGVATFEIPGKNPYSIKFENFQDYYFIVNAMDVNSKLVSEEYLNDLKYKIVSVIDNY